jgi:hypothetical protein
MENYDKIVTFKTYYDPMLAEIIKGKLEANSISCYLADENMGTIMPIYNQAIGGVKIRVFEHDLEKAKLVIAADVNLESEEEAVTENGVACPYCGSTNARYGDATERRYDLVAIVIAFLFMTFPFYSRRRWHCFNCGKDFK